MDNQDLDIINGILSSKSWLKVTEPISFIKDRRIAGGKIEIETQKGVVMLNVFFSADFPLDRVEFYCTNHFGYSHEMNSGLLCLNAAPAVKIGDRLELELDKLETWIDRYFLNEEKDDHFEYYEFPGAQKLQLIFDESQEKEEVKQSFGRFNYGLMGTPALDGTLLDAVWLAYDIGGRKAGWSETFLKLMVTGNNEGLWVKVAKHPVIKGRKSISEWKDLLDLLSTQQQKFIYKNYASLKGKSGYIEKFLLCIGYEIPADEGHEMHWDLVTIPFDSFPYESMKVRHGIFIPHNLSHKVMWATTYNASYSRLFGRGKLCDKLTNSKILIAGTGAIGSSLFMALVRGGCRNITISDSELIEPGNMCRSQFSFKESGHYKIQELYRIGFGLSPFLDISLSLDIKPILRDNPSYTKEREKLNEFDYIFDCSTNKFLSIMLDDMELKSQIVNFSITNGAQHMAIITGKGNIHAIKSSLFNKIAPKQQEPFFVAPGCWHPTFQASFSDISVLLHYCITEMSMRLGKGLEVSSFLVERKLNENNALAYEISYNI